ncbi:MAG TPA: NAD+ synthase [Phycisphaerae bacterium]|nr:NAD+ synthase [Phycisphaerae bacterium]
MRIALAQIDPTVGDIVGNLRKHLSVLKEAKSRGAEVVVFPELSILGYPPKDLLLKPAVIQLSLEAVEEVARAAQGVTAIVGYAERNVSNRGRPLHNAVAVVRDGKVVAKRFKSLLPTYDVFDESRYFEPGPDTEITKIEGRDVGVSICEDLWNDEQFVERPLYHFNPIGALAEAGAKILLNISASPFVLGKNEYRHKLFGFQAQRWGMPIVYVNQVGGNDELVFDGNSVVFDAGGNIIAQAKDFEEDLLVLEVGGENAKHKTQNAKPREGIASIHAALVLGLRDYVRKCGFKKVVLGLSGGIDSAVVAALAAEALGAENVMGVSLPSRYSSDHSKSDAHILAERLGIAFHTVPIELPHEAMERALEPLFKGTAPGLAEENIQARLRGNILMALSNKFGHMLLTTGNKSEVAVGYCTLYGDMCGGLAVISDVPKTMVYELARYINSEWERKGKLPPIPENTITKAPSAELKPNQTDQDSLPPYEVLDAIIERYVEQEKSVAEIIGEGFDVVVVGKVVRLVDISEYKRKQMAPGIKVTSRAFGFGRRMPIAQGYDPKLQTVRGVVEAARRAGK